MLQSCVAVIGAQLSDFEEETEEKMPAVLLLVDRGWWRSHLPFALDSVHAICTSEIAAGTRYLLKVGKANDATHLHETHFSLSSCQSILQDIHRFYLNSTRKCNQSFARNLNFQIDGRHVLAMALKSSPPLLHISSLHMYARCALKTVEVACSRSGEELLPRGLGR